MCLALAVPSVFAGSDQDTQAQIEALQAQIKQMQEQYQNQLSSVQTQLDAMKEQLLAQQGQANEKDLKIAKLEEKYFKIKKLLSKAEIKIFYKDVRLQLFAIPSKVLKKFSRFLRNQLMKLFL